jgi:hypothetical protein
MNWQKTTMEANMENQPKTENELMGEFVKALVQAQKSFKQLVKSKTVTVKLKNGQSYSYQYADLPACIEATEKALHDNGIFHYWTEDANQVHCVLIHITGAKLVSSMTRKGTITDKYDKEDHQTYAGLNTFFKRYAYCNALGLASEEDSDAIEHVQNGDVDSFEVNDHDLANYIRKAGKGKGKKLSEFDVPELDSFVKWASNIKDLKGAALQDLHAIKKYLAELGE